MIMSAIKENGEYTWSQSPSRDKKIDAALKNLHWIEFIKRKSTYGNVFIATPMGAKAIQWNDAADLVNGTTNGK